MRPPRVLLILLFFFICMTIIGPVFADDGSADSTTTTTHVRTWQNPARRFWEQKHRVFFSADEFIAEGDRAKQGGDYYEALGNYNTAVDQIKNSNILSDSEKNRKLAEIYRHKAELYRVRQDVGDDALAARADEQAQSYVDSGTYSGPCPVYLTYHLTPLAATVQEVKDFRDGSIMKSYLGSRFMKGFDAMYSAMGPSASGYIDRHPLAKTILKLHLAPLLMIVIISQYVFSLLSFNAELATAGALVTGGVLYGLIYLFPLSAIGMLLAGQRGRHGLIAKRIVPISIAGGLVLTALATGLFLSLDLLTVLSSGFLVLYCMIITAGVVSFAFCQYLVDYPSAEKLPAPVPYPVNLADCTIE